MNKQKTIVYTPKSNGKQKVNKPQLQQRLTARRSNAVSSAIPRVITSSPVVVKEKETSNKSVEKRSKKQQEDEEVLFISSTTPSPTTTSSEQQEPQPVQLIEAKVDEGAEISQRKPKEFTLTTVEGYVESAETATVKQMMEDQDLTTFSRKRKLEEFCDAVLGTRDNPLHGAKYPRDIEFSVAKKAKFYETKEVDQVLKQLSESICDLESSLDDIRQELRAAKAILEEQGSAIASLKIMNLKR